MSDKKTILIADSGSTKTAWKLLKGNDEYELETPGINPYYQNSDEIRAALASNIQFIQIIAQKIEHIYFYGAGCSVPANNLLVQQALRPFFPDAQIEIAHDMLAAARALCGVNAGIACILGTGSNSCFFDGQNITHQIDNLGFWLGDEGSGGYLGKQLVINWFHKEMPTDLWQLFSETYQPNRDAMLDKVYKQPYPNRYLASFSIFLKNNIHHPWCIQQVAESFQLFFERYVARYPNSELVDVHFLGSVAYNYSEILSTTARSCGLRPGKLLGSAIEGLSLYHQQ